MLGEEKYHYREETGMTEWCALAWNLNANKLLNTMPSHMITRGLKNDRMLKMKNSLFSVLDLL